MDISVDKAKLVKHETLKANYSVAVNDSLVIRDFKVVNNEGNVFVSLPSVKGRDGNHYDTIFFLKNSLREQIKELILDHYNNILTSG